MSLHFLSIQLPVTMAMGNIEDKIKSTEKGQQVSIKSFYHLYRLTNFAKILFFYMPSFVEGVTVNKSTNFCNICTWASRSKWLKIAAYKKGNHMTFKDYLVIIYEQSNKEYFLRKKNVIFLQT